MWSLRSEFAKPRPPRREQHRAALAPLSQTQREDAWKALIKRTEHVGKMKNAKVWLLKAIAEEDAKRGAESGAKGAQVS